MAATYDVLYKIVLLGDSRVGKTALLLRYLDNIFSLSFISTVGIDFRIKTITVLGKRVKLQIWDTAGQEQFQSISPSYYRNAHGIMIIYDVTGANSFIHISKWVSDIKKIALADVKMVLVGNKCEQDENVWVIGKDRGTILAKGLDIPFVETSAMNNVNVDKAFELLTRSILEPQLAKEKKEKMAQNVENEHINLKNGDSVRGKNCCR